MKTIEELQVELKLAEEERDQAHTLQNRLTAEMNAKIEAARRVIEAEYLQQRRSASDAASKAYVKVRMLTDELANAKAAGDPDVGRKVKRVIRKDVNRNGWRSNYQDVTEYGVVEIITSESVQPNSRGYSWRKLQNGTKAIRLLNAQGKPLKTVVRFQTLETVQAEREKRGYPLLTPDREKAEWKFVD